ncbi:MAG: hypothetical protein VX409_02850 [Verrucomicrobiota bacterium]|nr:hypothetical protein [Verrucomicrobiota bacterium]
MIKLDNRTMDLARTAGISALAAAIAENVFTNLTFRYKDSAFLSTKLRTAGTQVASGLGMIALGSNQRKSSSGKQIGELLSTIGIGVITSGVYTYALPEVGKFMTDLPVVGKTEEQKAIAPPTTGKDDPEAAGYTQLPVHDYTPVALNGYQATPSVRQDETQIHLGNAGIQKSELNTYQVVN